MTVPALDSRRLAHEHGDRQITMEKKEKTAGSRGLALATESKEVTEKSWWMVVTEIDACQIPANSAWKMATGEKEKKEGAIRRKVELTGACQKEAGGKNWMIAAAVEGRDETPTPENSEGNERSRTRTHTSHLLLVKEATAKTWMICLL